MQPAFAIAFYPGCETELKRGYEAVAPLLMLVGQADDWTAAAPCRALAREAGGPMPPEIEGYAGAYHGFDSDAPVRVRKDVPSGVNPGPGRARRRQRRGLAGVAGTAAEVHRRALSRPRPARTQTTRSRRLRRARTSPAATAAAQPTVASRLPKG